jgi:transposase-like protein
MKSIQDEKLHLPQYARGERRYFSESARRAIVQELDEGKIGVIEASRLYKVSVNSLYKWLRKYSPLYQKKLVQVVEHQSESLRRKALEHQVGELERLLGQKQVEVEYWKKLVETANEALGIDLKKNFGSRPCSGSTKGAKEMK